MNKLNEDKVTLFYEYMNKCFDNSNLDIDNFSQIIALLRLVSEKGTEYLGIDEIKQMFVELSLELDSENNKEINTTLH